MWAVWLLVLVTDVAPDVVDSGLLDEIAAGAEANVSRVQHGRCTYTERWTKYLPGSGDRQPSEGEREVAVEFDGPNLWWELPDRRGFRDIETDVDVARQPLGAAVKDAASPNVVCHIYDHGRGGHANAANIYDPRALGFVVGPHARHHTISDIIRSARQHPDVELSATREEYLVKVTWRNASRKLWSEYWIDPGKGYSMVRLRDWFGELPNAPSSETESRYIEAEKGVFIADHVLEVQRKPVDGRYVSSVRRELSLRGADLSMRPDPARFTIDGLGLPIGAQIFDVRNRSNYLYGIKAVGEEEVNRAIADLNKRHMVSQSSRHWPFGQWGLAGAAILFAIAMIVIFASHRLRRRSISSEE